MSLATRSIALQGWWRSLATRERVLLALAFALTAVTLAQFAGRALVGGVAALREDVAARRDAVAIARQLAALPATMDAGRPLLAAAEDAAGRAGLGSALKRMDQDDDGRVRVRLEGAAFATFAGWLGAVQRGTGAQIESLLIARGQGPGLVDVTLTLAPAG